jgi:deazaflavin-dependent oxidoreductase (nitroreductase family)
MVAVASNGGMSKAPQWYLNLLADPCVEVSVGAWRQRRSARVATPLEKAEMWPAFVASYRHFSSYEARTDRIIPLVVFEAPVGRHGDASG